MINNKLKIVGVITLALLFTFVLNKTIFLANTLRINPEFISLIKHFPTDSKNFMAKLQLLFHTNKSSITSSEKFFSQLPQVVAPKNIIYSPITKGVYAEEDKKNNIKYMKIEKGKQVEVREYRIKLKNGQDKIIKVLIPL